MTNLPLALGEYRTASGTIEIVYIGKHGKWAFDAYGIHKWHIETGEHSSEPRLNIIARHDPSAPLLRASPASGSWRAMMSNAGPVVNHDHWSSEVGILHSQLDWVRAERDEAVAALRRWLADGWHEQDATRAFLAKIGGV